jgi:peptide/nickel transport system permease protein
MGRALRRVAMAPIVLAVVATVTYAMPRVLRPDLYADGQSALAGVAHDLERVFVHFDLGRACGWIGCPSIREMWLRGAAWDLWLLGGALLIGAGGGVLAGLWCAARTRSPVARTLEAVAMLLYCTPVYVVALVLLLLFNPTFGALPLPAFFDAEPRWVSPFTAPWTWFRQLLVPWLVLGAPLGAMCLRLTLATTVDALGEDFVRTGIATGLRWRRVVRHAARASFPATASFAGVSVPLLVTNLVLVERTLSVPGFFRYTWKALGHTEPQVFDFPMLCALTLWGAVLIIVLGLILDAILPWLDPRVRTHTE